MPAGQFEVTVTPINFDRIGQNYREGRERVFITINEALREIGHLVTPVVKRETPTGATGRLRNVTVFEVLGTSLDQRLEIRQSAFSPMGFPYGRAVRRGTVPHFPPVDALIPWVIKKLAVAPANARSVAFLVARKISRVGTKPNPYHSRVLDETMGGIQEIVNRVGRTITARLS